MERVDSLVTFKKFLLPDGKAVSIPSDINIQFPSSSSLGLKDQHYLAYIPWEKRLIRKVPLKYRRFFRLALPYLNTRTTDVHTAVCLGLLKRMLADVSQSVDEKVIYIGLILHDSGWSQLSEQEIADSLSYTGLSLSAKSLAPKQRHAELGMNIAKDILSELHFRPLSETQRNLVEYIILHHDIPRHLVGAASTPLELYLVCDADRLWSYTHECFWQDTIRKGVGPEEYWRNLSDELDGYFYTPQGKAIATDLLTDRQYEVEQYKAQQM